MAKKIHSPIDPAKVVCIILGGGGGKGLYPLTRDRATPAVPLAGNYRLVDVPISNCINSGLRQLYVLTQFNSASLHRHVSQSYKFDQFTGGFVEIRAAQQTFTDCSWYQGTADAVRKNLDHFLRRDFEYALILSADQLYRQDFRPLLAQHAQTRADVTISTVVVSASQAAHLGILQCDRHGWVQQFVEKPSDPGMLQSLRPLADWPAGGTTVSTEWYLASMGTYVFNRDLLACVLDEGRPDFGRDIIPALTRSHRVLAYFFDGYWADIGAVRSYLDASLDLAAELPRFNFFDLEAPLFSEPLYLPGAKVNGAQVDHALLGAGCIVNHAKVTQSIVGPRGVVDMGSDLHRVILMGADFYESLESITEHERQGLPRIGIGRNARVRNTIIDRNARIGDNVVIDPAGKPPFLDHPSYFIRDGIVIVPRNGTIPHGMVI
jgi:glucose-1-phosphate adenylyltransferase